MIKTKHYGECTIEMLNIYVCLIIKFQLINLQLNIRKIVYLKCGERYEVMIDHRSYTHNLSNFGIKAWHKSIINNYSTKWR